MDDNKHNELTLQHEVHVQSAGSLPGLLQIRLNTDEAAFTRFVDVSVARCIGGLPVLENSTVKAPKYFAVGNNDSPLGIGVAKVFHP